ncbi:MAG: DUF2147 domain-containing protein [Bacteroidota bacterium]
MKLIIQSILMLCCMTAAAQSPVGTWKTVDDDSGEARSYVEIYEAGGKLYGKITKLLNQDSGARCDQCSGAKKNKPVVGLVIIEKMEPQKNLWEGGTILDPENGNEYDCEFWMDGSNLKVKGKHWTGFSRTQTWYPL